MKTLTTTLARDYAAAYNARALRQIADWATTAETGLTASIENADSLADQRDLMRDRDTFRQLGRYLDIILASQHD